MANKIKANYSYVRQNLRLINTIAFYQVQCGPEKLFLEEDGRWE